MTGIILKKESMAAVIVKMATETKVKQLKEVSIL